MDDDYEIVPEKEIQELKDELATLRGLDAPKQLSVSVVELDAKIDKLLAIFDEALKQMRSEENTPVLATLLNEIRDEQVRMSGVLEEIQKNRSESNFDSSNDLRQEEYASQEILVPSQTEQVAKAGLPPLPQVNADENNSLLSDDSINSLPPLPRPPEPPPRKRFF